ncbi:Protein CREG1 [Bagarius yarrelli]|uniref:Protein CREG1 n=1 Tax=Bagarius yarrelli TaxID=175774 RepID=A0A556TKB5_BAGYA|nr:Protein CREG1 [Bagarius yarrelli]
MAAVAVVVLILSLVVSASQVNIPPHEEVARMARFVVNQCDWASMATISSHDPVKGQPFSNTFSISDGPPGNGTGIPYMYLTHMEISVQDLQENPQASLSVSLAQTPICRHKGYDPQSPLCAHIILSGFVQEVNDTEADFAKKVLFSRHPEMIDWPTDHNWFFAKMQPSFLILTTLQNFILQRRISPKVGPKGEVRRCLHHQVELRGTTSCHQTEPGASKKRYLPHSCVQVSQQHKAFGPNDPTFCYMLDVFLLLYGIIITGMFLREKRRKPKDKLQTDPTYAPLTGPQSTYHELRKDAETGHARGGRRKVNDDTYTALQGKTEDTYKAIQVKKERRPNDQVYQGLSAATKDTYDSLHMQSLSARR